MAFTRGYVSSIVIDPVTAQSRRDLFNGTSYTISKVIEEDLSYGVILGGHAAKLERNIREHTLSNVVKLNEIVNTVNQTGNNKTVEREDIPHATSTTNFLDPSTWIFRYTLFIAGLVLLAMVLLGLAYHLLIYKRRSPRLHSENKAKEHYMNHIKEMQTFFEEFHSNFTKLSSDMKTRQIRRIVEGRTKQKASKKVEVEAITRLFYKRAQLHL